MFKAIKRRLNEKINVSWNGYFDWQSIEEYYVCNDNGIEIHEPAAKKSKCGLRVAILNKIV